MSQTLGRHFCIYESASSGIYSHWYGFGKQLIGWALPLGYAATFVKREWPFCYCFNGKVLLPFPSSSSEWIFLRRILHNAGATPGVLEENIITKVLHNTKLRLDLSHAVQLSDEYLIPGLKTPVGFEKPLFQFQEVAVKYLDSLGWRGITGDDMGLGKTPIGIACALKSGATKIVVVTRSVALGAWRRAWSTWSDYTLVQAQGVRPIKSRRKDGSTFIPEGIVTLNTPINNGVTPLVVLLNYELLTAWSDALHSFSPHMVIFDEVHAVKEPKAQRSKVAYSLMLNTPYVIGLTGTPISNKPVELYSLLHHIQPGKWGEFFPFVRRYCNAQRKVIGYDWKNCTSVTTPDGKIKRVPAEKYAWDFSGSSLEKELYKRLRSNIMVRRLKDDVLDLLPPIEETIPIEPSKRYWEVESGELIFIDGILSPSLEKRKKAEQSLHTLFAAAAMDKVDWAREWLAAFLEDTDQKLVIFFHYQRVGEALHCMLQEWGIDHVNIWGGKPDADGDLTFQENPSCRIALCSYSMAREAITLTSAAYQLSMEYPWVPGWAEQARDRTRRIGQTRAVTYYYPVLIGSAEEKIVRAMLGKQDIISVIMQGRHRNSIGIDTSVLTA